MSIKPSLLRANSFQQPEVKNPFIHKLKLTPIDKLKVNITFKYEIYS